MSEGLLDNAYRIRTAKENIRRAILQKGVPVPSTLLIDSYADKIAQISGGGTRDGVAGIVEDIALMPVGYMEVDISTIDISTVTTLANRICGLLNRYFDNAFEVHEAYGGYAVPIVPIGAPTGFGGFCVRIHNESGTDYLTLCYGDMEDPEAISMLFSASNNKLWIAFYPIQNGVILSFFKQGAVGAASTCYAFVRGENADSNSVFYVCPFDLNHDSVLVADITQSYRYEWNEGRPEIEPRVLETKVSMSKLLSTYDIGDVYIATTVPGDVEYSLGFTIGGYNYITTNDGTGYCPVAFVFTGAYHQELPAELVEIPVDKPKLADPGK